MIKVSVRREFNANFKEGKAVRVVGIKALSQLPDEYIREYPHCFKNGKALIINKSKDEKMVIKEGELYNKDELDKAVKLVEICGNRLRKINSRVRSSWETKHPKAIKI